MPLRLTTTVTCVQYWFPDWRPLTVSSVRAAPDTRLLLRLHNCACVHIWSALRAAGGRASWLPALPFRLANQQGTSQQYAMSPSADGQDGAGASCLVQDLVITARVEEGANDMSTWSRAAGPTWSCPAPSCIEKGPSGLSLRGSRNRHRAGVQSLRSTSRSRLHAPWSEQPRPATRTVRLGHPWAENPPPASPRWYGPSVGFASDAG